MDLDMLARELSQASAKIAADLEINFHIIVKEIE